MYGNRTSRRYYPPQFGGPASNAGKGRPKGSLNRKTEDIREKLKRCDADPIIGMAQIAKNNLPCGVCSGEGKTRYNLPEEQQHECDQCKPGAKRAKCLWCSGTGIKTIGVRTCQSCYGTLFEACSPDLRGRMFAELAQYVESKRKAIEVSNPDGTLTPRVEIVYVEAPRQQSASVEPSPKLVEAGEVIEAASEPADGE